MWGNFYRKIEFIERIEVSVTSQREAYHWLASSLYPLEEEEKVPAYCGSFSYVNKKWKIFKSRGTILPHIEHELITEPSNHHFVSQNHYSMERSNRTSRFDPFCIAFTQTKIRLKKKKIANYEMFSGRNIYANIKAKQGEIKDENRRSSRVRTVGLGPYVYCRNVRKN